MWLSWNTLTYLVIISTHKVCSTMKPLNNLFGCGTPTLWETCQLMRHLNVPFYVNECRLWQLLLWNLQNLTPVSILETHYNKDCRKFLLSLFGNMSWKRKKRCVMKRLKFEYCLNWSLVGMFPLTGTQTPDYGQIYTLLSRVMREQPLPNLSPLGKS